MENLEAKDLRLGRELMKMMMMIEAPGKSGILVGVIVTEMGEIQQQDDLSIFFIYECLVQNFGNTLDRDH